jgi:hypothetical protein
MATPPSLGPLEHDHGEMFGERGHCRLPLRRREEEWQQHQRRAGALDPVRDAGVAGALRRRSAWRTVAS